MTLFVFTKQGNCGVGKFVPCQQIQFLEYAVNMADSSLGKDTHADYFFNSLVIQILYGAGIIV